MAGSQQQRSQPLSQQSFSHSQLSQGSLDENLLSLHLTSPSRDQHLASSVHKMGMVLDSVQNDVMQLNRAMKEASLDSGSIQQKVVALDNSVQKIGIVRAIRSLNSRPAAIQMPTRCTTNGRPLMNQLPVANGSPQVNQTPVASLVSQTPVANGRHLVSQTPAAHGKTLMNQTSVANGRSLMSQVPAANGQPLMSQIPAPNGRPVMSQRPAANGRMDNLTSSSLNGFLIDGRHPAPLACRAKVADPKLKVEEGKMKALPQKLTGCRSRVTPKQEEVPIAKVTRTVATNKKAPPAMIIIDSDDDSEGRASFVILKSSESGDKECHLMKEAAEESLQILRRARKRRRREMQAIVPAA
ncbi:hypothetical protein BAE44_0025370 [Dichanthelium oligosanthes]|uniref:Protein PAIR1 n=1 Tax=Dichanthelium oligosanthes TaxID=888268 RepID=A0A1E5UL59_9POAL|nr:hypothetical protein BAE44_0025370 [Dichanthelium oligosanthes]